jgi:hypothetical protein
MGFWLYQLKADSRTLVAAVRYVLEPEPPPPATNTLNQVAPHLAATVLAMPTNATATTPKAYRHANQRTEDRARPMAATQDQV